MHLGYPRPFVSAQEYLDGEQRSPVRHEYVNGRVYAMVGGSDRHGLITANFGSMLNVGLPDRCQVFIADMKIFIRAESQEIFYYPDVLVSCEERDREPYYRTRPCLIVEVISPSTERTDRFEKFMLYKGIDGLEEYVLVAQDVLEVTVYRRSAQWAAESYREGAVPLDSVGLSITVADIYRRVRIDAIHGD